MIMIRAYYLLVKAQRRTCDETNTAVTLVPDKWRADVAAMLAENGCDLNGYKIEN